MTDEREEDAGDPERSPVVSEFSLSPLEHLWLAQSAYSAFDAFAAGRDADEDGDAADDPPPRRPRRFLRGRAARSRN